MASDRETRGSGNTFPAIGVLGVGFCIGTVTSMAFPFTVLLVVSALVILWFLIWHVWFDPQKDSRPQYLMSSYTLAVLIQAGLWYPAELVLALRFVLYAGSSIVVIIGIVYGFGMLGLPRTIDEARTVTTSESQRTD